MIRTANEKYITLTTGEIAIPLNKTRVNERGETEALMLAFMRANPVRELWVLRSHLRTDVLELSTSPTVTESMFGVE